MAQARETDPGISVVPDVIKGRLRLLQPGSKPTKHSAQERLSLDITRFALATEAQVTSYTRTPHIRYRLTQALSMFGGHQDVEFQVKHSYKTGLYAKALRAAGVAGDGLVLDLSSDVGDLPIDNGDMNWARELEKLSPTNDQELMAAVSSPIEQHYRRILDASAPRSLSSRVSLTKAAR